MKLKNRIVFFMLIGFFFSCRKDENKKIKFNWIKNQNTLFYNIYTDNKVQIESFTLTVSINRFSQNSFGNNVGMDLMGRNLIVKKGGLFGEACKFDCGFGILTCVTKMEFLYAPNAPTLNQELPQYSCGPEVDYYIKIIELNKQITVPYGTFNTYVMLHENGDKSYWNADTGIIMYEIIDYNDGKTVLKTLKLNRIQ